MAKHQQDPLFDFRTYKGCRITKTREGHESITVEAVRGTTLNLVFSKNLDGWTPRLKIVGYFTDQPEPNHTLIYSSDATEAGKALWRELEQEAFRLLTDGNDERTAKALAIINGNG